MFFVSFLRKHMNSYLTASFTVLLCLAQSTAYSQGLSILHSYPDEHSPSFSNAHERKIEPPFINDAKPIKTLETSEGIIHFNRDTPDLPEDLSDDDPLENLINRSECSPRTPSGSPVKLSESLLKTSNVCQHRRQSVASFEMLANLNKLLWCSDVGLSKQQDAQSDLAKMKTFEDARRTRDSSIAAQRAEEFEGRPSGKSESPFDVLKYSFKPPPINGSVSSGWPEDFGLPPYPGWKPASMAQTHSAREVHICENFDSIGAELGLSLQLESMVKFQMDKKQCPGYLALASVTTGRYRGNTAHFIIGTGVCADKLFPEDTANVLALALSDPDKSKELSRLLESSGAGQSITGYVKPRDARLKQH